MTYCSVLTPEQKQYIFKRDNFTCQYCGRHFDYSFRLYKQQVILEIDHIIPQIILGGEEESNLCAACSDCNQLKKDVILSDEVRDILKFNALWLDNHEKHFVDQFGRSVIIRPAGLKSGWSFKGFPRYRYRYLHPRWEHPARWN